MRKKLGLAITGVIGTAILLVLRAERRTADARRLQREGRRLGRLVQ